MRTQIHHKSLALLGLQSINSKDERTDKMSRLINLVIFYSKRLVTSKFYMGSLLVYTLLLVVQYYRGYQRHHIIDYGSVLRIFFTSQQILFLVFAVYFYRLFASERAYSIERYFVDAYRILGQKIAAMTFVHMSIQGIFFLIQILLVWGFYRAVSIPWSSIYLEVVPFVILYCWLPTFISLAIGVMVASMVGRHKISFAILLMIWLLLGPMNTEIFLDYFRQIQADDWRSFLYLSTMSIYEVYQSYIGYSYSLGTVWKGMGWLFVSVLVLLISLLRFSTLRKQRIATAMAFFLVSGLAIGSIYQMTREDSSAFNLADEQAESVYYQDHTAPQADLRYHISQYTIKVEDIGNLLSTTIALEQVQTTTPTFQLHHAFPIQRIVDEQGKEQPFQRQGDMVNVSIQPTTTALTFDYTLTSQYFVKVHRDRWLLPATGGWYPKRSAEPIMQYVDFLGYSRAILNPIQEPTVKFQVQSKQELLLNIPKIKPTIYEGVVDGLAVIKAPAQQQTIGRYQVVYPLDWTDTTAQFELMIARMEQVNQDLKKLIPNSRSLPGMLVFQSGGGTVQWHDHFLLYPTDSLYEIDSIESTAYSLPIKLAFAHINQQVSNPATAEEWHDLTGLILAMRHEIAQAGARIFQPIPFNYHGLSTTDQQSADFVYSQVLQADEELQDLLLSTWFAKIEQVQNDWQQIEQLVREVLQHEARN